MVGGPEPDKMLAAVVGTDMRGDRIKGAPNGVAGDRSCWAVRPGMDGDRRRDSAATAATRRQSSSPKCIRALDYFVSISLRRIICTQNASREGGGGEGIGRGRTYRLRTL